MKKVLFAAAMLFAGVAVANAEETSYAPAKGDISTSVQFNPFNNDYTFKIDAFQFSYMLTDKDAILADFGLNARNWKDVPDTDKDQNYTSGHYGTFNFNVGYARHFYNYKRIDLYAGAKIGFAYDFASSKQHAEDADNKYEYTKEYDGTDFEYGRHKGFILNFNVFTGMNFYVYKGLYVGVELDMKMSDKFASNSTITETTTINGNTTTNESKTHKGGHDFNFDTTVEPLVKLGWTF